MIQTQTEKANKNDEQGKSRHNVSMASITNNIVRGQFKLVR